MVEPTPTELAAMIDDLHVQVRRLNAEVVDLRKIVSQELREASAMDEAISDLAESVIYVKQELGEVAETAAAVAGNHRQRLATLEDRVATLAGIHA